VNQSNSKTKTNVIVVGGGFGGVRAAEKLSKREDLEVTLISAIDSFAYYPQLYHAATGGAHSEASIPLKELLGKSPINLVIDPVTALDSDKKQLKTQNGETYQYDQLVMALGSVTNYFGITGLAENSFDIKTIEGAEKFKQHLHDQLIRDKMPEADYIVVGAGPTGVELASALVEYLSRIVRLHNIKHGKYSIDLIEAAPRILPRSSDRVAAKVRRRLEKLGVKILTNSVVQQETVDELIMKDGSIRSKTVVWTAGVSNNPFFRLHNNIFHLAKNGKVEVDSQMEGATDVYVIGDSASTQYSGLAQTAVLDADFVVKDMIAKLSGNSRKPYKQRVPATVTPVGSWWAAAQVGKFEFYGIVGWLLRRVADLIAYSDVESKPEAIKSWLKETIVEDDCVICNAPSTASSL
jgi:NADH dehydrogenase